MTPVFLDTSVIVRKLFGDAAPWTGWKLRAPAYCSRVARLELKRTLDRERLTGHLDDESVATAMAHVHKLFAAMHVVELSADLLDQAEAPLPTVVKSLDALHLVTAVALKRKLGSALLFVTHDEAQGRAARALGLAVEGVGA